jgi:predicted transcriptional regulator
MKTTTIRIRSTSYDALKEIADSAGSSIQEVFDQAISELLRMQYLKGANDDYARLKSDGAAIAEFNREIAEWDTTNRDGL